MLGQRRGQSTLEYAIIIGVVVAALLAVNIYMQRGVQGKLKESTDQIGRQFQPTNDATYNWTTNTTGNTVTSETRDVGTGATTSNISESETITRGEGETWGK